MRILIRCAENNAASDTAILEEGSALCSTYNNRKEMPGWQNLEVEKKSLYGGSMGGRMAF